MFKKILITLFIFIAFGGYAQDFWTVTKVNSDYWPVSEARSDYWPVTSIK